MVDQAKVPVTFVFQNMKELREANKLLGQMGSPTGSTAKATKSTGKFGRVAQNTSYQVQDLIVQIQGGTDPMRAMSQQLPQMAIGMGMWGAAIGLAAAALPALIVAMKNTEQEALSLDDALAALDSTVGNIGRTMGALDMSNWIEQFNKAGEAQRNFMLETLELDRVMAERARRQASESIGGDIQSLTARAGGIGRTGRAAGFAATRKLREDAESLGLTVAQLKEVIPLYKRLEESQGSDQEAVGELRSRLIEYNSALDKNNEKLNAHIDATWQLSNANRALAQSQETVTQAEAASAAGGVIATAGKAGKAGLTPEMAAFIDQRRNDIGAVNESMSEKFVDDLTLAEVALSTFDKTFDSAVDGIARGTQSIGDAFTSMTQSILAQMGKLLAEWLTNQAVQALFGSVAVTPNASGNVISGGTVQAFAKGGVVSGPTVFPMANGMGLMGEAGPEAVMPLGRNSRGELGVKSAGMNVTINNMAPGVSVQTSQTEDGLSVDIVMEQVAAAVRRGGNSVSDALENSYSLNRGASAY